MVRDTFRERFDAKGRLSSFVKSIPTRLIVNSATALLGAARAAEEIHYASEGAPQRNAITTY